MADSPDISRVISVIMEHPELVAQISSLLSSSPESETEPTEVPVKETEPHTEPAEEASLPTRVSDGSPRRHLLLAIKPYLSEKRSSAIDTMLTVSEILDKMRRG